MVFYIDYFIPSLWQPCEVRSTSFPFKEQAHLRGPRAGCKPGKSGFSHGRPPGSDDMAPVCPRAQHCAWPAVGTRQCGS